MASFSESLRSNTQRPQILLKKSELREQILAKIQACAEKANSTQLEEMLAAIQLLYGTTAPTGYFDSLKAWKIASSIEPVPPLTNLRVEILNMNSGDLAQNVKVADFLVNNPTYLGDFSDEFHVCGENLAKFVGDVLFIGIQPVDYLASNKALCEFGQLALLKVLFAHKINGKESLFFAKFNNSTGFLMQDIAEDKPHTYSKILGSINHQLRKKYKYFKTYELEILSKIGLKMIIALAKKGLPKSIVLSCENI